MIEIFGSYKKAFCGGDLDGVLEHDDAGDDERENKDGGDEDVSCESSASVEMNRLRNSQRTTILCHGMMPCLRISMILRQQRPLVWIVRAHVNNHKSDQL